MEDLVELMGTSHKRRERPETRTDRARSRSSSKTAKIQGAILTELLGGYQGESNTTWLDLDHAVASGSAQDFDADIGPLEETPEDADDNMESV